MRQCITKGCQDLLKFVDNISVINYITSQSQLWLTDRINYNNSSQLFQVRWDFYYKSASIFKDEPNIYKDVHQKCLKKLQNSSQSPAAAEWGQDAFNQETYPHLFSFLFMAFAFLALTRCPINILSRRAISFHRWAKFCELKFFL